MSDVLWYLTAIYWVGAVIAGVKLHEPWHFADDHFITVISAILWPVLPFLVLLD